MSTNWKLEGQYFEACNCDAACPCVFLSPPTTGECTVLIGWHIAQGNYGDLSLDGLTVLRAIHTPGAMMDTEWTAALYLDANADAAQVDALTQIFRGEVGGSPSKLSAHIATELGVRQLPIAYKASGGKRSVSIQNIADVEITAMVGQGDGDITISGHPLCVAPGHTAVVARSDRLKYADYDFDWELNDKTAFFSRFTYAGP